MRKTAILVGAVIITGILVWIASEPEKPALEIKVTGYTYYKTGPLAHLRITNIGPPVRWYQFGFPQGELQVKNGSIWEKQNELGTFLNPRTILRPGEVMEIGVGLRGNPPQWRLHYNVQTASLRERAALRLKPQWRNQLEWVCDRLLPNRPAPLVERYSDVFCGSNFVEAHHMEETRAADFDAVSAVFK